MRLDRALCNLEWKDRFSNVLVHHLPRVKSDHTSVLIQLESVENMPRHKDFSFKLLGLRISILKKWFRMPGIRI